MRSRRHSLAVKVGSVSIGGNSPIVVQSMTNTDTADIEGTVAQVKALARAGSELVRVTVNNDESAAAVPHIRERLDAMGINTPLVGDFHFNGHKLLKAHPGLRRGALQAAHQPRQRRARQQARSAVRRNDRNRDALSQAGAHRRQLGQPRSGSAHAHDGREFEARGAAWPAIDVMREAIVVSALDSAKRAEELGLGPT
jgi:(E)-4-hydroxy-3-methylbut-2-enyl-diphosphate synthase